MKLFWFLIYGGCQILGVAVSCVTQHWGPQAFLDGNKRTAIAAALTPLDCNEVSNDFNSMPLYEAMVGIAERRMDKGIGRVAAQARRSLILFSCIGIFRAKFSIG